MDGLIVAGRLFSITCTTSDANDLEARFLFTLTTQSSNTVVKTANDKQLQHSSIARVSHAGKYICNVNVTSAFLNRPIISNTTVTLTVQSKEVLVLNALCAYGNSVCQSLL